MPDKPNQTREKTTQPNCTKEKHNFLTRKISTKKRQQTSKQMKNQTNEKKETTAKYILYKKEKCLRFTFGVHEINVCVCKMRISASRKSVRASVDDICFTKSILNQSSKVYHKFKWN